MHVQAWLLSYLLHLLLFLTELSRTHGTRQRAFIAIFALL